MSDASGEVRTTCPYCGVGCGVIATRAADGSVAVRGDPQHPANFGRLCSKGSALAETLDLDGRLLFPEVGGQRVSWEVALDAVATGLRDTLTAHGPEAVALYVSGQLLTEDYYVANKLVKGFIGTANIDTNSRLCMSSSVAGHKRAFGTDTVPGSYEDLEAADLIVLVGSNLAWCHPVLYQRILAARAARNGRPRLVVIDPRRTASCDQADQHLAIAPGTDSILFDGLLVHLHRQDCIDLDYVEAHTEGYLAALRAARAHAGSVPDVARACGLPGEAVAEFFAAFARTAKVVTVYSQGVNQSSCGTDKVNAILNCHLASGRIGKPGMGPFSVTGQPNAMGGREVGGLANQLAAHMDFAADDVARVQRFWAAPVIAERPGLKAVDMFRAVAEGRIKAIWVIGTNPVVSLPDADAVRAALHACPLVIVSDAVADTDTVACAHIRLPAATWGEKDGTVTNSERCISRQRAFLPLPGAAQPDWWILCEVARRLGFGAAFDYAGPAGIFAEHAALSAFENDPAGRVRDFDIGACAGLDAPAYDALTPFRWPQPAGGAGIGRFFAEGGFYTGDNRARFVALGPRAPVYAPDAAYPLVLNTGRVRDHWHTLTRTGKSARLSAHAPEPYAEIHPLDAALFGIVDDALVRVSSRWGEAVVRAKLAREQRPGSVFVPMHWGSPQASRGRIDAVVNPATDPHSGQPESKHTPVRIAPWVPAWHGFVLSREPLALGEGLDYRVQVRGDGLWRYEIAAETPVGDWSAWAHALLADQPGEGWIEFFDAAAGRYRAAAMHDGRLLACVFVAPGPQLPPRDWLAGLFTRDALTVGERASLLAGRPGPGQPDTGRVVCACFRVGVNTLVDAIRRQGLATPEAIGAVLKAGTNCGSCVPELRKLIAETAA
ncbi:assimilatory nitrate reductase (NADH) alpha subunit apoprotein [Plasticicumulans lactativorans]|uniref:nitrate reductase (cytochrome) n=1 Tax=Plasticicumulans lactativorans TaxID=1133106 RepID=A0A4R2KY18_9GAMM|nr:nitrate reductase [Plasticicumulans lactativorans]TCO78924.1 assimilatory nitrate reductase (NADH) alpha subunit apoprotein [Plasticicumulans lactativorans]